MNDLSGVQPSASLPEKRQIAEKESKSSKAKAAQVSACVGKNALQTSQPQETVQAYGAKELSALKGSELYKNSLVQRIVLKTFLSDALFGTKEQLAKGEINGGFNDIYREMIRGKNSHVQSFKNIESQIVVISVNEKSKVVGVSFTKEPKAPDRPIALVITGSYSAAEVYAAPLVKSYLDEGFDVLVIDPIGFGESQDQGIPTPENFMQSAEAAARYIRQELKMANEKVIVHGYSLGGFAAAHVASLKENAGMNVVLDRCSSSTKAITKAVVEDVLPTVLGKVTAKAIGKLVDSCVPFDLTQSLTQIHGKVFVAQTDLANDEVQSKVIRKKGSSAYALVEKLEKQHTFDDKKVTKALAVGEHITTYADTWTRKPTNKVTKEFKNWLHQVKNRVQT